VRFPRLARFLIREKEAGAPGSEIVAQISTLFREAVLGPGVPRIRAVLDPEKDGLVLGILKKMADEGLLKLTHVRSPSEIDVSEKDPGFETLVLGEHVTQAEVRFLEHEIKLDPDKTRISILRIVPEGSDPYAVDTLTIIPDEILEKPLDPGEAEGLLRSAFQEGAQSTEYLQELAIRVPSKEGMTEAVMEILDRLGGLTPLGGQRASELIPALREAVEGAIQVGNRMDPEKYVDITVLVDDEKIAVVVKDEGPAPEQRQDWAAAREGSGIASMIMKRGADEVEYLPPGNRVMLTKYY
jgi:anti-sigma regulatory factor (Ser/Thr protein kinase)